MAPADDRPWPVHVLVPDRPAISAFGSTWLLMAAIVAVSAVGSFGAVRAWFPKVGAESSVAVTVHSTDTRARVVQDVDLARTIDTPTAAGRLSIVTDPAGARIQVDGRPRGLSPIVIDGLTSAEHLITVVSDSGVAQRTIAVSNDVMTEVVFSLARPTAPVAGWVTLASSFPIEMLEQNEVVGYERRDEDHARRRQARGTAAQRESRLRGGAYDHGGARSSHRRCRRPAEGTPQRERAAVGGCADRWRDGGTNTAVRCLADGRSPSSHVSPPTTG